MVVFITGSGRRLGRAMAIRFAERGWDVAIHYGSSEAEARATLEAVESYGVRSILVNADVRNREQMLGALTRAADAFGGLDVLVNNAAIYPTQTPIEEVTEALWDDVIGTNLKGSFFTAQAAATIMNGQSGGGRIVNFASLGAYQIWQDRIPYHVSKAGVVQLTRALARALAPKITVNAVAPGAIAVGEHPEADAQLMSATKIPLARHGTPDDIFRAVWFFAAEATYITGQTLLVDGGLSVGGITIQQ